MAYEDWNEIEDEDKDELQDISWFEGKRDVILFCVDCSESMQESRDDPVYEGVKTSNLLEALNAAIHIQKRKAIVSPADSVGILLFNTTKGHDESESGLETKPNTFLLQPIETINAPKIKEIIHIVEDARSDLEYLRTQFPSLKGQAPLGDVFTSCNWVIRDCASKTAIKRVFLITDQDNPHPGEGGTQLRTSARTTLVDLSQAGVTIEPFFIASEGQPFDVLRFYSSVLPADTFTEDENNTSLLLQSISITRIEELLEQMRVKEVPKRSLFSIPFHLAEGFTIGVKGYGLITEQKKGSYQLFYDAGDHLEPVSVRTTYIDEERQAVAAKSEVLYGTVLGDFAIKGNKEDEGVEPDELGTRMVEYGECPFYTADEVRAFRTLGLEIGIQLLGFKDYSELLFEDNIKHSTFIYPDEDAYSGSRCTFSALLKSMVKRRKIGLVLTLFWQNSTPSFCAMVPQEEDLEENEPGGFHLIPLPFADDIRSAPIEEAARASNQLAEAAESWITKLSLKKESGYPVDSNPNPALAYHNLQLEAAAFREEFNPGTFEDLTLPNYRAMHKRAGILLQTWRDLVDSDKPPSMIAVTIGSKRKMEIGVDETEIRSMYESGKLSKLVVEQLKAFLRHKGENVSGKKSDLVERVAKWLDDHP
ncbi:Ku DNA-binding complex, Ku70 subunit [Thelephora ganbajun]|uniref:Ku DNA-binding complex, Ku70 subunit n=1 Tax=Thelephora ganbajun TaxID=370292 RepID=A0ACB6ZKX7_THEGA|nr:Ku DNA-binding complex, Ku70 subunit [Thelephora ganbajun]